MTTDRVIGALAKYGGRVLTTSLPKDVEREIHEALNGAPPRRRSARG
jgi:uncharacterized membrane protein